MEEDGYLNHRTNLGTNLGTNPGTSNERPALRGWEDLDQAAYEADAQEQRALSTAVNFSNDCERALCSSVMRGAAETGDVNLHAKLYALLSHDEFHIERHQAIWSLGAALHNAGLETSALTIADAAARQDVDVGTAKYLGELLDDPICRSSTAEALLSAAHSVKGLALVRRLESSLSEAKRLCAKGRPFDEVASYIEDDITNLRSRANTSRSSAHTIGSYLGEVLARIQAMTDGQALSEGIPSGFPNLDALTGGLMPETLIVLAARPAMGKTAFALNIARNIACASRVPVLIFSLEMTGVSLAQRMLATDSRISLMRLKGANLHDDEWPRMLDSVELLSSAPIFIDESPGLTLSNIRARTREFKLSHPKGVVLIDYMQIVAMDKLRDKFAHVAEVSRGLKDLAREVQMPVVALAQLSRDLERRTNKRPMMSDLRESGQIEQDAEVILFLYRDEVYNPDTPDKGVTEAIVGKNRDGSTGTVRMSFTGELMNFSELGVIDSD